MALRFASRARAFMRDNRVTKAALPSTFGRAIGRARGNPTPKYVGERRKRCQTVCLPMALACPLRSQQRPNVTQLKKLQDELDATSAVSNCAVRATSCPSGNGASEAPATDSTVSTAINGPAESAGGPAESASPASKQSRATSLKQRGVGTPAGHLLPPRGCNDTTPRTRVLLRARNEIFEMLGRRKRSQGASQPADAAAQGSAPPRRGVASNLVPRGGAERRVCLPAAPESQRTIIVDDTCAKPCLVCFRADTSLSVHQPAFMLFGPSEKRPSHYALISVDRFGHFFCTSNDNGAATARHSQCRNRQASPPGHSDDDAPQACPHAAAYFAVCRQLVQQQAQGRCDDEAGPADEQLFVEPFRITTDASPVVPHGRKYQTFIGADKGIYVLHLKGKRQHSSTERVECLTCVSYTCEHARHGAAAVTRTVSSFAARTGPPRSSLVSSFDAGSGPYGAWTSEEATHFVSTFKPNLFLGVAAPERGRQGYRPVEGRMAMSVYEHTYFNLSHNKASVLSSSQPACDCAADKHPLVVHVMSDHAPAVISFDTCAECGRVYVIDGKGLDEHHDVFIGRRETRDGLSYAPAIALHTVRAFFNSSTKSVEEPFKRFMSLLATDVGRAKRAHLADTASDGDGACGDDERSATVGEVLAGLYGQSSPR